MKVIFEDQNTATINYPVAQQVNTTHDNREYTKIGKSYQNLSIMDKCIRVIQLIVYAVLNLFLFWSSFADSISNSIKVLRREISQGREKTIHYIPAVAQLIAVNAPVVAAPLPQAGPVQPPTPAAAATAAKITSEMNQLMKTRLDDAGINQIQSALCILKIEYSNTELKQDYIIKSVDNTPLSLQNVQLKIDQIKLKIEGEINNIQENYQKYEWLILFKHNGEKKHLLVYGHHEQAKQSNAQWVLFSGGGGSGLSTGDDALAKTDLDLQDLGFPSLQNYLQNDEFVPGPYHVVI